MTVRASQSAAVCHNHVLLRGRIPADPEVIELPSGDEIVTFRLVVPRSIAALRRGRQRVDTFDCTVWTSALKQKVLRWSAGDHAEIEGELRRRFHRGAAGVMSRVTVDVSSAKRTTPVASRT